PQALHEAREHDRPGTVGERSQDLAEPAPSEPDAVVERAAAHVLGDVQHAEPHVTALVARDEADDRLQERVRRVLVDALEDVHREALEEELLGRDQVERVVHREHGVEHHLGAEVDVLDLLVHLLDEAAIGEMMPRLVHRLGGGVVPVVLLAQLEHEARADVLCDALADLQDVQHSPEPAAGGIRAGARGEGFEGRRPAEGGPAVVDERIVGLDRNGPVDVALEVPVGGVRLGEERVDARVAGVRQGQQVACPHRVPSLGLRVWPSFRAPPGQRNRFAAPAPRDRACVPRTAGVPRSRPGPQPDGPHPDVDDQYRTCVAVIGGATAGAEAADKLAQSGALCVVFEQNDRPYGKVEDGLPLWHTGLRRKEYDLIDSKLTREGVIFVPRTGIGRDVSFNELVDSWGFDMIVLANGAWRDRPLPVTGAGMYINRGLVYQNPFIYWFNHYRERGYNGPTYEIHDDAAVVGGGLASIDVVKVLQLESVSRRLKARGIDVDLIEMEVDGIPETLARHGLKYEDLGLWGCTLYYR